MRPPPMMQNNFMPMPMNPAHRPLLPKIDPSKEVWVETNSAEGKTYFYNAKTRQSVWKRPNGDNIQIIMQSEVSVLTFSFILNVVPPRDGATTLNAACGHA